MSTDHIVDANKKVSDETARSGVEVKRIVRPETVPYDENSMSHNEDGCLPAYHLGMEDRSCPHCNGYGWVGEQGKETTCNQCQGSGDSNEPYWPNASADGMLADHELK